MHIKIFSGRFGLDFVPLSLFFLLDLMGIMEIDGNKKFMILLFCFGLYGVNFLYALIMDPVDLAVNTHPSF